MQPLELVINYLVDVPIEIGTLSPQVKDPNSGLKQVITEFLNAVMLFEAYLQSGALPYERSPQRRHTETAPDRELSRPELAN